MKLIFVNEFKNLSLYKKMIFVFSIMTGIICIISMLALSLSFQIYDKKLYEKSQQELDFFTQQINYSLKEIENTSVSIAMNEDIQKRLSLMTSKTYLSADYYYELEQFRRLLVSKIASNSQVKNVIYTDRKNVEFVVGTYTGQCSEKVFETLLNECNQKRGGYAFQVPTEDYPYLLTGREILEKENTSLDYLGTIIFTIDVAEIIQSSIDNLSSGHLELFVYSDEGMIYRDEGAQEEKEKLLPSMEKERGYKIMELNQGKKTFMCYEKSSETGWMYVNFFPYSKILGQTILVRNIVFLGFVIVFVAMTIIMKRIAKMMVSPLESLTESMKIVEKGKFNEAKEFLVCEARNDEIGILVQEFKVMLEEIDDLIHENYEKQLLIQKTKYKMLQAQINPHFLYNTLNTINWMIRATHNKDASKMIIELGKLLRASLTKEEYISAEDETKIVESYIIIQQFRYKGRAEFVIERKGNLEKYYVPKMILQPLVENAITYGVEECSKHCKVTVRAEEREEEVWFEVIDEGPGISESELKSIQNFSMKPKGNGIGLKNIYERLKIADEKSKFQICSQLNKGTRIEIKIPKKEKGNV